MVYSLTTLSPTKIRHENFDAYVNTISITRQAYELGPADFFYGG